VKVLFICRGNIGRSVFASHLYNKITGTDNAFSAGTVVNNEQTLGEMGEKVQNVIQVMNEENIDVSSHLRKQVSEELVQCADIVIDMAETDTIPDFVKNHLNRIIWEVDKELTY
jgi:protein-tyrosine-phosphatase